MEGADIYSRPAPSTGLPAQAATDGPRRHGQTRQALPPSAAPAGPPGGRVLRGDFNAKSVRKAIAAVEAGEVAVIVQGKLEPGDVLVDAGVSAMPKAEKE